MSDEVDVCNNVKNGCCGEDLAQIVLNSNRQDDDETSSIVGKKSILCTDSDVNECNIVCTNGSESRSDVVMVSGEHLDDGIGDDVCEVVCSSSNNHNNIQSPLEAQSSSLLSQAGIDDEIEDETIEERLAGLLEMFPEPILNGIVSGIKTASTFTCNASKLIKKGLWIISTSFVILIAPVIFEHEMNNLNEQVSNDVRQMMLGPVATAAATPVLRH